MTSSSSNSGMKLKGLGLTTRVAGGGVGAEGGTGRNSAGIKISERAGGSMIVVGTGRIGSAGAGGVTGGIIGVTGAPGGNIPAGPDR